MNSQPHTISDQSIVNCYTFQKLSTFALFHSPLHLTAALHVCHAESWPGCQCSFPKCTGHAAWQSQPLCTLHRQRNSTVSMASWVSMSRNGSRSNITLRMSVLRKKCQERFFLSSPFTTVRWRLIVVDCLLIWHISYKQNLNLCKV